MSCLVPISCYSMSCLVAISCYIMSCLVAGTDVNVSWFKEGKPLKSADNLTIGSEGSDVYYVQLKNCNKTDSGEYTCTASNLAGGAFSTVNVTVKGKTHAAAV